MPDHSLIGRATPRIDGRLKVTGAARYGADAEIANPAFAYLVTSRIARGRIARLDDTATRAVSGVLDVLTHRTVTGQIKAGKFFAAGGYVGSTILPLGSERVFHAGQIVAVVVADSFEAAREGAHRLVIDYAEEPPAAGFDSV